MNHDDLVARYSTPLEDLSPEMRARVEQSRRKAAEQLASGDITTPEQTERQQQFPIGLDDKYNYLPRNNESHDDE